MTVWYSIIVISILGEAPAGWNFVDIIAGLDARITAEEVGFQNPLPTWRKRQGLPGTVTIDVVLIFTTAGG